VSIYYVELLDVLTAAGCTVAENSTTAGWQTRARSSGGFAAPPLGVQWHHTASQTSPANDLSYMIDGCPDAPVGNLLLDRTGTFWPIAAGAANTAGKGGPLTLSRGTVKTDSANSTTFAIEAANAGTGVEPWPTVQIDAYFAGSNALNELFGNLPTDVFSHALGDGDCPGWTDRKIDPATADTVEGPWQPRSVTSSGTWALEDIRAECSRRAGTPPPPDLSEVDTMLHVTAPGRGATLIGPGFRHYATNDDEPIVFERAYGPPVELSDYDYDMLVAAVFVNQPPT
jgi:hypothetical protein